MDNFKAPQPPGRRNILGHLLADEAAKLAISNGLQESRQFIGFTRCQEFDPAVGKIANPPGNFEAGGDPADGLELLLMRDRMRNWRFYDSLRTDADALSRRP